MFIHILISTLRRIRKYKYTYLVSFIGLSTGLIITFILGHIFIHEISFDTFHSNHSRKFLLEMEWNYGSTVISTPPPSSLYETIKGHSSVYKSTRVFTVPEPIVYFIQNEKRNKVSSMSLLKVDSEFFEIFNLEMLNGSPLGLFSDHASVLCTKRFANKLNPSRDVIGKYLQIEGQEYLIEGIIKDWPDNSSLKFDLVISTSDRNLSNEEKSGLSLIYFELFRPETTPDLLQNLNRELNEQFSENESNLKAIPLAQQHLETDLLPNRVPKLQLVTFITIGIVILIVTLSNYSNHSITISIHQLRNVGIKNVLGAGKFEHISNFIVESLIVVSVASIISITAILGLQSQLNELVQLPVGWESLSPRFLVFMVVVLVSSVAIITLIVYTATSSIPTVDLLVGNKIPKSFSSKIANFIVAFQCTITSIFIILTFTIINQRAYLENLNTGFDKSDKLIVDIENDEAQSITNIGRQLAFQREIERISSIKSVSSTSFLKSSSMRDIKPMGSNESIDFHSIIVDENFINLFDIKLIGGTNFSDRTGISEVIVNESAYNLLQNYFKINLGDPFPGIENSVLIGVVQDFLFNGFRSKNSPLLLEHNPNLSNRYIIEYNEGTKETVIGGIKQLSAKLFPDTSLEIASFESIYEMKFLPENRLSIILVAASALSICISLFGLVGTFQFISSRKRKEMSIRKVFGARSEQIAFLYFTKFLKLLMVCFLIATPIGYLLSDSFLSLFAFKIELGLFLIISCILIQISIVALVLGFQIIRSSITNPIVDLRND